MKYVQYATVSYSHISYNSICISTSHLIGVHDIPILPFSLSHSFCLQLVLSLLSSGSVYSVIFLVRFISPLSSSLCVKQVSGERALRGKMLTQAEVCCTPLHKHCGRTSRHLPTGLWSSHYHVALCPHTPPPRPAGPLNSTDTHKPSHSRDPLNKTWKNSTYSTLSHFKSLLGPVWTIKKA